MHIMGAVLNWVRTVRTFFESIWSTLNLQSQIDFRIAFVLVFVRSFCLRFDPLGRQEKSFRI